MGSRYDPAKRRILTTVTWRGGSGAAAWSVSKELLVDTGAQITIVNFANAAGKALNVKGVATITGVGGKKSAALVVGSTTMDVDTEAKGGGTPLTKPCSLDVYVLAIDQILGMDQMDEIDANPYREPGTTTARLERV